MSKKDINIQKATPTELFAKKAPYSSLSNDVVASIRNPDALAIWVYLQTRSGDWKVIGSYLQTHFNIGRDRYRKAMADLNTIGLISHELQRDPENGQVMGKRIIVHYEPNVQVSAPPVPKPPKVQVSHHSADPHSGETTPYLIKDLNTQLLEKEPTGDKSPPLPRKSSKFDPVSVKPANVSEAVWADWCQHRREIRKPLTAKTCEQQTKALEAHQAPDAVINLSISNGWTGLFPEKVMPTNQAQSSRHNGFATRDYTAGLTPREDGTYAF